MPLSRHPHSPHTHAPKLRLIDWFGTLLLLFLGRLCPPPFPLSSGLFFGAPLRPVGLADPLFGEELRRRQRPQGQRPGGRYPAAPPLHPPSPCGAPRCGGGAREPPPPARTRPGKRGPLTPEVPQGGRRRGAAVAAGASAARPSPLVLAKSVPPRQGRHGAERCMGSPVPRPARQAVPTGHTPDHREEDDRRRREESRGAPGRTLAGRQQWRQRSDHSARATRAALAAGVRPWVRHVELVVQLATVEAQTETLARLDTVAQRLLVWPNVSAELMLPATSQPHENYAAQSDRTDRSEGTERGRKRATGTFLVDAEYRSVVHSACTPRNSVGTRCVLRVYSAISANSAAQRRPFSSTLT